MQNPLLSRMILIIIRANYIPEFGDTDFDMMSGVGATTGCLESAANSYPVINACCRKSNGDLISPSDLESVCTTRGGQTDNDPMCVDPNTYLYRKQTRSFSVDPRLHLCSKDGIYLRICVNSIAFKWRKSWIRVSETRTVKSLLTVQKTTPHVERMDGLLTLQITLYM